MTSPALKGGLLALLAAALFGASTPLLQHAGRNVGPFMTAALLYAGAALVSALMRRPAHQEAAVVQADLGRLVAIACFGAVIGPVALAWGLQRTSGASASLMLTLEAFFTVVLARLLYRETLDRRVWLAMLLLLCGGALLVADQGSAGSAQLAGLAAVLLATAAWGVDNTLSRALAERDPGQVVLVKATLGACCTAALSIAAGEAVPDARTALALLAVGASGYGLSLRFYLLAQRQFGAARTGSVFAFAPFIGGLLAFAAGDRSATGWMLGGGVLMLAGVLLHLMERHHHLHAHEAMAHAHAHSHDDGHHDHVHLHPDTTDGATLQHNHWHQHAPTVHAHPHVPDAHHRHTHD
ncbi:MAG: multidrug transporter [Polaromonas sp.]|nr:multidrug transporter [Polaromonas sp.]